jgi:hypothetical protein
MVKIQGENGETVERPVKAHWDPKKTSNEWVGIAAAVMEWYERGKTTKFLPIPGGVTFKGKANEVTV